MMVLTVVSFFGLAVSPAFPVIAQGLDSVDAEEILPAPGFEAEPTPGAEPYDVSADEAAAESYDDGYDPQAYLAFQDELAPYGEWVDDPFYGRVWVPFQTAVGTDFAPYATGGRWILTEYGWTWVSIWNWGWAPFHYGRWVTLESRGWCWVPGTMWGPGWVSWRSGGGYVGWAALPPRGTQIVAPVVRGSPWRFAVAHDLGKPGARYGVARGVFARTAVVSNARVLSTGAAKVRINAGPSEVATRGAVPVRLRDVAPHVLPHVTVQPRVGIPVASRPWKQGGSLVGLSTRDPSSAVSPRMGATISRTVRPIERSRARTFRASSAWAPRELVDDTTAPVVTQAGPAHELSRNHASGGPSSYTPPATRYAAPAPDLSAVGSVSRFVSAPAPTAAPLPPNDSDPAARALEPAARAPGPAARAYRTLPPRDVAPAQSVYRPSPSFHAAPTPRSYAPPTNTPPATFRAPVNPVVPVMPVVPVVPVVQPVVPRMSAPAPAGSVPAPSFSHSPSATPSIGRVAPSSGGRHR